VAVCFLYLYLVVTAQAAAAVKGKATTTLLPPQLVNDSSLAISIHR
jgi:hypothetical protein